MKRMKKEEEETQGEIKTSKRIKKKDTKEHSKNTMKQ